MIYIDPPYNTGSDFVYNDDFATEVTDWEERINLRDEARVRLQTNKDTSPRYHSDWCSMMYPRLQLARNLLTPDGVIFISIDDNEVHHLRAICDEVFGASNFVGELVWERAFAPKNDAKYISNSHDYVLIYARRKDSYLIGRLQRTIEANARYSNPDNDPRGVWMSSDITAKTYNAANDYPITTPSGRIVEPTSGRCWRLSSKAFEERVRDGRIWFGPDGSGVPRMKRFLSELRNEGMVPTSILFYREVGHSQEATQQLNQLMEGGFFDGPKPLGLLDRLMRIANLRDDSIILDFFSGSATTAHAVMQLNAEDGGRRRFIMVQLPEVTDEGSEAYKAGYRDICEIGKERIRRAGAKIKEENPSGTQDLDTGFRVFRIDSPNERDVLVHPEAITQDMLADAVDLFQEGRSDLDILYGCLVDWGVPLDLSIEEHQCGDQTYYQVGDTAIAVACFEENITLATIERMAAPNPLRVILLDRCFRSTADRTNLYEHFKRLCQWSDDESYQRIRIY